MRFILAFIFFILFLIMAIITMFVGGVSGVAATFYVMVNEGDIQHNLTIAIIALLLILIGVMLLRSHNKKIIKRKKQINFEQLQQEKAQQAMSAGG